MECVEFDVINLNKSNAEITPIIVNGVHRLQFRNYVQPSTITSISERKEFANSSLGSLHDYFFIFQLLST